MNVESGFKRHLRWIVPLVLIPLSAYVFSLLAVWALPSEDEGGLEWLVVVSDLCLAVAPIVFLVLTIVGAQKTYRRSRLFEKKMQKRTDAWARKMEKQIPECLMMLLLCVKRLRAISCTDL